MRKSIESLAEFVVCINNVDYPASLELHKIYRVISDEDAVTERDIRVIDESGADYLREKMRPRGLMVIYIM